MTHQAFVLAISLIGLTAFLALVLALVWVTVYLAKLGKPVPAAFTGAGAVIVATKALFTLLTVLGQSA